MEYVAHKRFKKMSLSGEVNIPALSILESKDGALYFGNKVICMATSENAHEYFAYDDDGNGIERGNLTQDIKKKLAKRDDNYQARWDKIWDDECCQKYKRADYGDYWLWNNEFYSAPVEDLRHIWELIGG